MIGPVVHYGMILLDAASTLLRVRGQPLFFRSADENVGVCHQHGIKRWMVYGRADGGWTVYTMDWPVHPLPEPPAHEGFRLIH